MAVISPQTISLVQQSWSLVLPISDAAASLFYDRLFALEPSVRPLFKQDMTEQKRKLMQTLNVAVGGLYDLGRLVPVLEQLGARHAAFMVREEHFAVVGQALLWTLREGLGDGFTPAIEKAWTEVYQLVSSVMIAAMKKAAPAPKVDAYVPPLKQSSGMISSSTKPAMRLAPSLSLKTPPPITPDAYVSDVTTAQLTHLTPPPSPTTSNSVAEPVTDTKQVAKQTSEHTLSLQLPQPVSVTLGMPEGVAVQLPEKLTLSLQPTGPLTLRLELDPQLPAQLSAALASSRQQPQKLEILQPQTPPPTSTVTATPNIRSAVLLSCTFLGVVGGALASAAFFANDAKQLLWLLPVAGALVGSWAIGLWLGRSMGHRP